LMIASQWSNLLPNARDSACNRAKGAAIGPLAR
jgi:hypothetical protein